MVFYMNGQTTKKKNNVRIKYKGKGEKETRTEGGN